MGIDRELDGLVEVRPSALGCGVERVGEGVVDNANDGYASHCETDRRSDHGIAMNLTQSIDSLELSHDSQS